MSEEQHKKSVPVMSAGLRHRLLARARRRRAGFGGAVSDVARREVKSDEAVKENKR